MDSQKGNGRREESWFERADRYFGDAEKVRVRVQGRLRAGLRISETGPLPFAEAEKLFRLVLANFGGKEHRTSRIGCVFKEQSTEGGGPEKVETATIEDSVEIRDSRGSRCGDKGLHRENGALGKAEVER